MRVVVVLEARAALPFARNNKFGYLTRAMERNFSPCGDVKYDVITVLRIAAQRERERVIFLGQWLLRFRMWRSSCLLLSRTLKSAARCGPSPPLGLSRLCAAAAFSTEGSSCGGGGGGGEGESISFAEAKRLMRLVNVDALKMKLGTEGKEVIGYSDLLQACEAMGVAKSRDEATAFARVLDEAGVILLFRDKVYLHPDKVVDLVRRAVPLVLSSEDDPRREELKMLQENKGKIDMLAHRQVRRILWSGLGMAIVQVGLFFRLTFWEFSWDVMEPIAFFATATGIVIGYAYFLFTSRDPSYQDLMKRLYLSRQRRLIKKHNFDVNRFMELQKQCKHPLDASPITKNSRGAELEPEDAFH